MVNITEQDLAPYKHMVAVVSADYGRRYADVGRDDIEQECWMWFLTHPLKFREWRSLDKKDSDKLIAQSLRNASLKFCVKERAATTGYSVEDLFWYTPDFIKELLPSVLSEDWVRMNKDYSQGASNKSPAESGDWMAYAADVARAYESLNDNEKLLVKRFYADDITGEDLHSETEHPTARAAMMAANRAVYKMVKFLGGKNPLKNDKDYVNESDNNG